jgi:DnaJ-class molecular chaperone
MNAPAKEALERIGDIFAAAVAKRRLMSESKDCPRCGGTGEFSMSWRMIGEPGSGKESTPCSNCEGTGKVPKEATED